MSTGNRINSRQLLADLVGNPIVGVINQVSELLLGLGVIIGNADPFHSRNIVFGNRGENIRLHSVGMDRHIRVPLEKVLSCEYNN